MKKTVRRSLALLLALLTLSAFPMAAEAANDRYPADQYFVKDESETKGFAVQVSSSGNFSGSCGNRDKMLKQGYDSYVYDINGQYRVMCGKFRDYDEALHYKDSICSNTNRKKAYVTNVYLPDWAYTQFEDIYRTDPVRGQDAGGWEEPTGPYVDGDVGGATKTVYTVQFSSGSSFHVSELHRDDMIARGFDAFVYRKNGKYRTLSGMFQTKQEAQARCEAIKTYTDQSDAYVTTVDIPTGSVEYRDGQDQTKYYAFYRDLLVDCRWASYCMSSADAASFSRSASSAEQYLYYVCDIDGNGVDELIVTETFGAGYGAAAVFSCNADGAFLLTWVDASGNPDVLVCQEKGILAVQQDYNRVASCRLIYIRNGWCYDTKEARVNSNGDTEVAPTDVDRSADGYYIFLTGYQVTDLKRLGGGGRYYGPSNPTPAPTSSGYTHDGVLEAARKAAASSKKYRLVSTEKVELEVPETSQFFANPFTMTVYAKKNGKAIYIMPKPQKGNGNLGKIKQGETVTILAQVGDFYFFVAANGRAGWNGTSYFR